jgi:Xaa-Pro aminopeptidase
MKTLLVALFLTVSAYGQPLKLDPDVFAKRRQAFMEKMEPGSIALFASKPEYERNLDVNYEYRQESNFYYLSGFEEPGSLLLIAPSHPRFKYVLFVRKRDPGKETFEGPRAGTEGAIATYHADTAFVSDDLESHIRNFSTNDGTVYYGFGVNPEIDNRATRLFVDTRSGQNKTIRDPAAIVDEMRLIKNAGDWSMGLKKAIDISVDAHNEVLKAIRPGMYEYEVQALFEYVYRKNGSPRNAYPCIIGSGPNATILHYETNTRQMQKGELVLMDCAAEYGGYAADITRTVPVSGTFTKEQKEIYRIVLDAQNAGMRLVKPGMTLKVISAAIDTVLAEGLLRLGFIKSSKDRRFFSLHGYSHWIGLEVHDVGGYTRNGKDIPLEPGMVFTIEPGLYIRPAVFDLMKERGYAAGELERLHSAAAPYLNIGVRIEDDILVTPEGYRNLSEGVPREVTELEARMKRWRNE